jgi:malonyl CoA-acyl carrier protein transacylase/NAD(P)-dependent dehydrogenase (short-subunit alcohol dehydrogenase family)
MPEYPRRAGVNALGFGGTNFHVVAEEYTQDFLGHLDQASFQNWPSELLIWKGDSRQALLEAIRPLEKGLSSGVKVSLRDLAFTLSKICEQNVSKTNDAGLSLAVVASSLEDLMKKLNWAGEALSNSDSTFHDPRGIYFSEQPLALEGKLAFLFPGQGSQYVNMLSDVVIQFPEIRALFERSNCVLEDRLPVPLSNFIFPPPVFSKEERDSCEQALAQSQIVQPAMGTADLSMFHLLGSLGIKPDMVAGHSYGEYVALCVAGVIDEDDLIALSEARGRFLVEASGSNPGTMVAINADTDTVADSLNGIEGVWIANVNAPEQTVISGTLSAVEEAVRRLGSRNILAQRIPVSCAFHTPIVSPACEQLRDFLSSVKLGTPKVKVFSNSTAKLYPADPGVIADQLVRHLKSRVEFVREIEAMYKDGARIFVEVGPGKVLSGLVGKILSDSPHLTVISNHAGRSGLVQLLHLIGQLIVQGVPVRLDNIYKGRFPKDIDMKSSFNKQKESEFSPTTCLVNGARVKPFREVSDSDSKKEVSPMEFTASGKTIASESIEQNEKQISRSKDQEELLTDILTSSARHCGPEAVLPHGPSFSGDGKSQVMLRFQQLMQHFLETQKSIMLSYLRGTTVETKLPATEISKTLQGASFAAPVLPMDSHTPPLSEQHKIDRQGLFPEQTSREFSVTTEAHTQAVRPAPPVEETILNREYLTSQLLGIVSKRTGYPQEMLDMDVDMESDLGIDSIKRVEILGHFLQVIFRTRPGGLPEQTEDINRSKTLREIIDHVEALNRSPEKSESEKITDVSAEEDSKHSSGYKGTSKVSRFTLTAVDAPLPTQHGHLPPDRALIVTDDGRGIAEDLSQKLKSNGYKVALIRYGETLEGTKQDWYELQDNSAGSIARLVETIKKRQGSIGGIIHLLPLSQWPLYEEIDMAGWQERLRLEVKTLFHLLKSLKNDLNQAAKDGGGCVVSATGMGGNFASGSSPDKNDFFPGHGAITGLLKTLDIEWPEVRVKAVDLYLSEPASDLADHLMAEIHIDDGLVEVGYDGSRRLRLDLQEKPIVNRVENMLKINSSWVFLITGGARGITAEVAGELARRYQPIMVLAGRSPLPPEKEPEETAGLTLPEELKAALIAKMKRQGERSALAEVETAYKQLCKEREIRSNLEAIRRAGAKVEYHQVDVRDEKSFGDLIDSICRKYGRLDGVIHGAGIIEDKLFIDKKWESFERVFGTKTDSAFILSHKLDPETLKLLVLFSSVAGRFGNRGQCDYAAANEVLNKMAVYLDKRWPGRVMSINWGPWEKSGMVSTEMQKEFARRGVQLIPLAVGPRKLDMEILKGQKGEVELVLGDGPWGQIEGVASGKPCR